MQIGDLVRWKEPFDTNKWSAGEVGIIVDINHWVDEDAPDRNFGTDVKILWPNGEVRNFFEDELEIVNDHR